jgi:hypothetical protein
LRCQKLLTLKKYPMKKFAFFFGVAFIASIALSSCKKDYTCECKYDLLGQQMTYSFEIKDAKKKDAEAACDYTVAGVASVNCELK